MKSINERPEYLKHLQFEHRYNCDSLEDMRVKFAVQLVNLQDKAIFDAIIKVAQEEKLTDLFLIDRDFVVRALRNQLDLESKLVGDVRQALAELNYYRNIHYKDTLGTESRVIADALNTLLPLVSQFIQTE